MDTSMVIMICSHTVVRSRDNISPVQLYQMVMLEILTVPRRHLNYLAQLKKKNLVYVIVASVR